jgi:hypothetical protein
MNLRTTPLLFGLLLGILWLFGLMLIYKKTTPDENLIVPSLQGVDTKDIDTVRIQFKDKDKKDEELVFQQVNEQWVLKQHGQEVRVEGFRIDDIIRDIKDAKRYQEERVQDDTAARGLPPGGQPRITVTLKGKVKDREKEWQFFVGNADPANAFVYVNSSDRPSRAYPVTASSVESLFTAQDPAKLRSKRLFDFVEPTVTSVAIKEGKEELALKKSGPGWLYEKPPLGFADFEAKDAEDALKKKDKFELEKPKSSGVKGLINAIAGIHVANEDDFEPLGLEMGRYGLEDGKEAMRIEVATGSDKADKGKKDEKKEEKKEAAKKEEKKEVLLVGKKAPPAGGAKKGEDQYYARMATDQGVFRIGAKMLEPLKEAVADPKKIRSTDVAFLEKKDVDAVIITDSRQEKDDKGKEKTVKDEVKLLHPDEKDWVVVATGDKTRKGSDKAVSALLDALQGKKAIESFADGKDDSWVGLNGPRTTEIDVYQGGLEKKEEKKDDKDKEKKDEKKADKDAKDKKDEPPPSLKKDAKPFVKLIIGNVDKEKKVAHVKRVLQDGTESRFAVPYSYVEKLRLDEGALAYLDPALPSVPTVEVAAMALQRGKDKVELNRASDVKGSRWNLADEHDPYGHKPADPIKVGMLLKNLTNLQAKKWVKKDDPQAYGLKDPQVIVTLFTKPEDRVKPAGAASLVGMLGSRPGPALLPALGTLLANRQADRGDEVTIKFGKEVEQDKEKLVYVQHSGSDLPFLVPADLVKSIRDADLRDRTALAHTQGQINGTLMGTVAAAPINAYLFGSPLVSGQIHHFDPAKVKEISIDLRTKYELRSFGFQRVGKGKDATWVNTSGFKDFSVDSDKVAQLVEQLSKLRTERFAGFAGPTGENKLTGKESTLKIEMTLDDNTSITLTVGAPFGQVGYFAHSTAWPDAVFFLPASMVDPWLGGVTYFGKERAAS